MSTKYTVNLHDSDGKIQVYLHRQDGQQGKGMPLAVCEKPEQAGTIAAFVQQALHDRYMDGLTDAFDTAMKRIADLASQ